MNARLKEAVLTPGTLIPIGVAFAVVAGLFWPVILMAGERAVALKQIDNHEERIRVLETRYERIDQSLYRLEFHAGTLPKGSK